MRKFAIMLALLLALPCAAPAEDETVAEAARLSAQARQVTSMAEAEAMMVMGEDSLWPQEPKASYAQVCGFSPVALTPQDAVSALRRAYDAAGGEGCAETLRGWGFTEEFPAIDSAAWQLVGEPRTILSELYMTGGREMSLAVVPVAEDGGWGDAFALVFTKEWPGDWTLSDCVPGEAGEALVCGDPCGALVAFTAYGHGSGFYAEYVSLYNPLTRRCEAAYTRTGHELYGDYGMYVLALAFPDGDGLTVVRDKAYATEEWEEENGRVRYDQRAREGAAWHYALSQDGGFALTASGELEDASLALLANVAADENGCAVCVP